MVITKQTRVVSLEDEQPSITEKIRERLKVSAVARAIDARLKRRLVVERREMVDDCSERVTSRGFLP